MMNNKFGLDCAPFAKLPSEMNKLITIIVKVFTPCLSPISNFEFIDNLNEILGLGLLISRTGYSFHRKDQSFHPLILMDVER